MNKYIITQTDTRTQDTCEVGYHQPSLSAARRHVAHLKEMLAQRQYYYRFDIQEFDADREFVRTYSNE